LGRCVAIADHLRIARGRDRCQRFYCSAMRRGKKKKKKKKKKWRK